ncbi:hypothetical protein PPYR_09981 [Photinus pyralis]|uniref:Cycle n=1 Tax=Photinus pyralis TaxID=7054 RepID=A0A1Y1NEK2_PHOPY|nr:protein cycle isoform X1 [Photinus pyralis]KAB0795920.1 hypothetical protein PPYR_09981 [Photinus pyralis]
MVARDFSIRQIPYARLLHVPDEDDFTILDESNPNQLNQLPQFGNAFYETTNVTDDPCGSSLTYQTLNHCSGSNSSGTMEFHVNSPVIATNRKRKVSIHEKGDFDEDDSKSTKTVDDNKKQNHSEIEKRRRDKMNTYITELSSMVPMCNAMSRKLDKLTVLRMTVQHIKSIRGSSHSYAEAHYKPSFLSDQELKELILQVADGFLFVVGCDRGKILYVSKSVSKILNYSQGDLLGQSWFDILHPKDIVKVKEQLSSLDLNPRERLIDAKTMLPLKADLPHGASRLCPGARRSFFCRMKSKLVGQMKEEADTTTGGHRRRKHSSDKQYSVIHCTGYLKSWAPVKTAVDDHESEVDETCNLSCLVAVGRILPKIPSQLAQNKLPVRPVQFVSRHAMDGKFIYTDQRATLVLGFLPQELLGTSTYEYYHPDDIATLSECHKTALQSLETVNTGVYRFRTKDDGFVRLQSEWKAFMNPWTKEIDYLISKNSLILADAGTVESSAGQADGLQGNYQTFVNVNGKETRRILDNQIETSKIGSKIADQVLDLQKHDRTTSSRGSSEKIFRHQRSQLQENGRDNLLETICNDPVLGGGTDDEIIEMMEDAVRDSPGNGPPTNGNDEAAMAVIMSLLEADAGLGGPVDFSGLPWPLP